MESKRIELLVIVGPTASGKTELSIKVAKLLNAEIIAADSRTIYKYLDIGTAKPNMRERSDIIHYGFDLVGPGETFSALDFKKFANSKIKEILKAKKMPIIVGGCGLYIDSIIYDYSFASVNQEYKKALNLLSNQELINMIKDKKLRAPENIKNKLHLVNTILRNGVSPSKNKLRNNTLLIGLSPQKSILKDRIINRAHKMVKDGVIEEIKRAQDLYGWESRAMTGGIYRALKPSITDNQSYQDALETFIKSDIQLVKKQMTWYKNNFDVKWFKSNNDAYLWMIRYFKDRIKE